MNLYELFLVIRSYLYKLINEIWWLKVFVGVCYSGFELCFWFSFNKVCK